MAFTLGKPDARSDENFADGMTGGEDEAATRGTSGDRRIPA